MKEKKQYIVPTLVKVTFKVEKGFAESLATLSFFNEFEHSEQMEDYSERDNWGYSDNRFWN